MDKAWVHQLAEGRWLLERPNALITGPTGAGKTFVACALGNAACRQGFRFRYLRLARLLSELNSVPARGGTSLAAASGSGYRRRR
ncbi:MAG: ATP-binding protein [Firmicutes bacterium]|nr:ATP-binding protein [Bacillota bacterium]